jgi:predicted PurR-regulated permease PerM
MGQYLRRGLVLVVMPNTRPARRFFFLLLAAVSILFAIVARPIASALFLAAVLAGVLWPLHRWLSARLRERRSLSAGALVILVLMTLVGPTVAFSAFAIEEGANGVRFVSQTVRSEGVLGLVDHLPPPLRGWAKKGLEHVSPKSDKSLADSLQQQVSAHGGKAATAVGATLSATGAFVFQMAMMLIALFFLLIDGDKLVAWLDDLSPLPAGQTHELLTEFKRVSFAVLLSAVLTSGVQAVAALIGFFVARVPHPIFFAGVTFFVAFIPAIGAASVCLVAAALLLTMGHPYAALFLALWGLIVVGLVDNLVKPLLIKIGMRMNGAVVFFALVGGLGAFGGVGLLLGPLVVALFLSLLRIYQRDYRSRA